MGLVKLQNLGKNYSLGEIQVTALKDINLEIDYGAFTSIIGPSGSGKTTLLNIMGCLDKPTSGRVEVAGYHLNGLSRRKAADFRGEHIGFVFQSFNLIPVLTVAENVEYPLIMIKKLARLERSKIVMKMLEAVGIADQAKKYPTTLSGGQKQRVAIARALATEPQLVLADEPTANLDRVTAHMVIGLMKQLRNKLGTSFVFSTHDSRIIDQVDMVFKIQDGQLITDGSKVSKDDVQNNTNCH